MENKPDYIVKDLHENSDYPIHSPSRGIIKPEKLGIIGWLRKLFG